jgi:hypothetical protein
VTSFHGRPKVPRPPQQDGTISDITDKATEKVCIERWQWTIAKVVAAFTIVSAIAHLGEALGELGKARGWFA